MSDTPALDQTTCNYLDLIDAKNELEIDIDFSVCIDFSFHLKKAFETLATDLEDNYFLPNSRRQYR